MGPLLFAVSALTSLMLLNYIAKQLGNLVGKGLGWEVIFEFFILSLPFTVAMTLPMAVLVSVLYAFSRLASENEITAMKANGVSMRRVLLPVLGWGMFFSFFMIAFNDRILPLTNHRLRTLQGDIARKKPSFALKEQIINEVSPGQFFLRTNHLDPETNKMRDVTIYDLSDVMRRHTIYADSGVMAFAGNGNDLKLTLYNGFIQEVPKEEPTKMQRLYYLVDEIRVEGVANAFSRDSSDNYKSDREMSVCELQDEVARFEQDFFRARARYDRAVKVARTDANAQVGVETVAPSGPERSARKRARVASLGRSYCDAVLFVDTVAVPWVRKQTQKVATLLMPERAFAQSAPHAVHASYAPHALQAQDTLKARQDSIRRADSTKAAQRADSVKAALIADSLRADSAKARADSARVLPILPVPQVPLPGITVTPQGDTIYPGATTAPVTGVPDSLGVAPSAGVSPTIPAAVEMESARGEMLRWRAQINQYAVEIHKKFAISAACTVFVLLGAPLALRFPRGGVGLVIGVSLGVFALYYVGLIAGESLSDRDILPPSLSMWAANIIFAIAGLVLFARMERDGGSARGADSTEFWGAIRRFGRRLTFRKGDA
ncbi:MAG: LptF/LptG family permease [Cytophagaceae bacterium]|nr:LptF/LptG family permease [Gemmatimonadaceae bacterium]